MNTALVSKNVVITVIQNNCLAEGGSQAFTEH